MTERRQRLLARLDAIAAALERSGRAQALLALGSAGRDTARLDDWSDLDFFAIVDVGAKAAFLDDLSWLTDLAPVAYVYRNTVDGYKLLYDDGVFCEFAVFEPGELARIQYAPGRLVWKRDGVDESIATPTVPMPETPSDIDWLTGEVLTNLYVGLLRHRRGERLAAFRMIQMDAVERLTDLCAVLGQASPAGGDPFLSARRFETRFPDVANELPGFMPGYDDNVAAARAILRFIDSRVAVGNVMRTQLSRLLEPD